MRSKAIEIEKSEKFFFSSTSKFHSVQVQGKIVEIENWIKAGLKQNADRALSRCGIAQKLDQEWIKKWKECRIQIVGGG